MSKNIYTSTSKHDIFSIRYFNLKFVHLFLLLINNTFVGERNVGPRFSDVAKSVILQEIRYDNEQRLHDLQKGGRKALHGCEKGA